MKAKCICSMELVLKDRTFRKFERGVIYDVDALSEDVVKAYFEEPEIAPSKEMRTRKVRKG